MRSAVFASLLAFAAACAPQTANVRQAEILDGDPARGLTFAQATCGSCHALTAGEAMSPYPAAPPFEAIANTPGMTRMALGVWMQSSHPSMPQLIVAPGDLDDVHAYMRTLKRAE